MSSLRHYNKEEKKLLMIKPKIYLENSVISMYYSDDDPYKRDLTRLFWKEVLSLFDVYISGFVIDEIEATNPYNLKIKLERLVRDFKVLEINKEIIKLSDIYLSCRRLPQMDARHLAVASVWNMNFLLTWNLKHLYKPGTQEMTKEVNIRLKIPVPIIVTPEDFLEEEA